MSHIYCTLSPPQLAQTHAATAEPATSAKKQLTPADRDQGFVADKGGTEQTSGELLLIEAYAAIWILVFAMIFMSIRKQKKLDQRITQLSDDLHKARKSADGGE
jgi:CcmD family protein